MKILHITNHFSPCIGGIENTVENICINLKNKGIESKILCLNKCAKSSKKLKEKEEINGIPVKRISFIDLKYYKIALNALFFPKKEFNLIHVHGIGFFSDLMLLTKIIHKKPVIISTYGSVFHTKKMLLLKKIYFNLIQKIILSFADKIIVISKADELKTKEINNNIINAPIGINFNKKIKSKKKKNSFLFVGRYSKNKKINLLIKTFSEIIKEKPEAKLFIIGNDFDNLKKEFKKQINELNAEKNIFLLNSISQKELEKKYSESEFFVSASEYESFGITVIEAMNYGLIPLISGIPSFKEFVENKENGFIIDYSEKNAGKKIIEIMNLSEKQKKELSEKAVKKAKEFNWNEKIKKYVEVYLKGV
jgi:alpha-1,3-mannosyltransferase